MDALLNVSSTILFSLAHLLYILFIIYLCIILKFTKCFFFLVYRFCMQHVFVLFFTVQCTAQCMSINCFGLKPCWKKLHTFIIFYISPYHGIKQESATKVRWPATPRRRGVRLSAWRPWPPSTSSTTTSTPSSMTSWGTPTCPSRAVTSTDAPTANRAAKPGQGGVWLHSTCISEWYSAKTLNPITDWGGGGPWCPSPPPPPNNYRDDF